VSGTYADSADVTMLPSVAYMLVRYTWTVAVGTMACWLVLGIGMGKLGVYLRQRELR